jgi:hypothetical protein
MRGDRKALKPSIRFNVFKRDGFRCQYCGRTPPDVVLEVDHIVAVADGGENAIDNLITACFDCNRGKAAGKLNDIPESLAISLEAKKEKQLQVEEYSKFLEQIKSQADKAIHSIDKVFNSYFPKYTLNNNFKHNTLRFFLSKLPSVKAEQAMNMACSKITDADRAVKYFCGICHNWIKNPETRDW